MQTDEIGDKVTENRVDLSCRAEDFEDNSTLAKWSSLDLLAEEDDAVSPTAPSAQDNQG